MKSQKTTKSEEDYLKAIFKLYQKTGKHVNTNAIAEALNHSAASVTDMVQKMAEKELLSYIKYKGVTLMPEGKKLVNTIIRKHRLWEYFLVNNLNFGWDEVHDIAEELEHISSEELVNRLDLYLGSPKFDPHGDPIPNSKGIYSMRSQINMQDVKPGQKYKIVGVLDNSNLFLQKLDNLSIGLGTQFETMALNTKEIEIQLVSKNKQLQLSWEIARGLWVQINS